jgi:hypothetical protein
VKCVRRGDIRHAPEWAGTVIEDGRRVGPLIPINASRKKTLNDVVTELEAASRGKGVAAVEAKCALAALQRSARFRALPDALASLEHEARTQKKNPIGYGAQCALAVLRRAGLQ